jgi:hypothetical protein
MSAHAVTHLAETHPLTSTTSAVHATVPRVLIYPDLVELPSSRDGFVEPEFGEAVCELLGDGGAFAELNRCKEQQHNPKSVWET